MNTPATTATRTLRVAAILAIALVAFVATYAVANAASGPRTASDSGARTVGRGPAWAAGPVADPTGAGAPACACCGGARTAPSEPVEGAATLEGDVQRITVDTSAGYYDPNVITLAAGVPSEITFTQASGCLAQVMSQDLGFVEDLTSGDVTVRLNALEPGTYEFSCGMRMVFGTIVVE